MRRVPSAAIRGTDPAVSGILLALPALPPAWAVPWPMAVPMSDCPARARATSCADRWLISWAIVS